MPWTVVLSKSGKERKAENHISSLGFQTFLPRIKDRYYKLRLVMPRYILVSFIHDCSLLFDRIARERRLYRALRYSDAGSIITIPNFEVERLKAVIDIHNSGERFPLGTSVRAVRGKFEGIVGKYAGLGPQGTELAEVEMLGRYVRTAFQPGLLELASEA